MRALEAFGFGSLRLTSDDFSRPERIVQLGMKPNRIDLITSISGVPFEKAWNSRVQGFIEGIPVPFLGIEDLIANKESTGRLKDIADAAELRKSKPV